MTTPPSSSSRLPRPTLPRSSPSSISSSSKYVSPASTSTSNSKSSKSRSRSKSSLAQPQPRILPFPELSLRAQEAQRSSREGSRTTSPISTPPIDRLEVTFDQLVSMSRGGSSEGNSFDRRSSGSGGNSSGTTTIPPSSSASVLAGSTSPPIPSPLALSAARLSRARASTAPSRPRTPGNASDAGTAPSSISPPTIGSSAGRNIPSPSPVISANRRTEGFRPASPALARVTTNVSSTTARPTTTHNVSSTLSTVSTADPSASSRSIPTILAPPTPVTPVKLNPYHHHSSHTTHTPASQAAPAPSTTIVTPIPTTHHIKEHLYHSFLKGVCADVRLVIKKWGVCYHVHKMILAQNSFFHTLFLGGFSETHPLSSRGGKGKEKARIQIVTDEEWNGEDVELTFDDPNITRAAFEICLSRLYSSYPHLHFPTDLLPSPSFPLTPAFPHGSLPNYPTLKEGIPPKAHLATPRLLLSLLATTIYLGQGVLMREVLAIILRTVGPATVRRYLSFATGDGIEAEEYSGQSEEGVEFLSGLAKLIQDDDQDNSSISRQTSDEDLVEEALHAPGHSPRSSSDSGMKVSDSSKQPARYGGIPIPSLQLPSRSNSIRSQRTVDDPFSFNSADVGALPHYYGVVGNKIGEACCCWLARWGADLLNAELENPSSSYRIWSHGGLPANLVRALLSSDYFFITNEMERYRFARKILDLRRSGWDEEMEDGGDLSLAASGGMGMEEADENWEEWEEEEREILKTFAEGIYYCHMTFDDLSTIASDIDPSTHFPYAPLSVLQAAHWTAADLRSRVTAHEKMGTPPSADDENELGLTQTTTAICSGSKRRRPGARSRVPSPAISSSTSRGVASPSSTIGALPSLPSTQHSVWFAVPTDETHKTGASGLLSLSTSTQQAAFGDMPDFGPDLGDPLSEPIATPAGKSRPPPHGERSAFGLIGGKMTGKEIEEKWINEGGSFAFSGLGLGDSPSPQQQKLSIQDEKWSKLEPFRFSVEFFDVDKLAEKERSYSGTHFYAGSYFNCYIQIIKRKEKGVQLGIYLHRQSPNEPFPIPSSPRRSTTTSSLMNPSSSLAPSATMPSRLGISASASPTSHNRHLSTSPMVPGSPPTALPNTLALPTTPAAAGQGDTSEAPYIDSRSVTKAFFSISCASAMGTALIRFTSGPDCFALSQSWGWKSSALRSEEYLCMPSQANQNKDGDGIGNGESNLEEGVLGWTGEIPNPTSSSSSSTYSNIGQCSLRATVVVGVV